MRSRYLNPFRIVLSIVIVNAAGIALRYYGLDTYFIFLGFRFHLSCLLPFVILMNGENLKLLSESFRKPRFRKKFVPLFLVIISLAVTVAALYLLKKIEPGDPDYFYEFGLSSIFDFPLYIVWNFPQLCCLFLTLSIISRINKLAYVNVFFGLILLFGYELIPFNSAFHPADAAAMLLLFLTASLFVTKLQNIYWFAVIVFSSVWSIILLFGSTSGTLINIFFAREYSSWDGFLNISKELSDYVVPSFFLILLVISTVYLFFPRQTGTNFPDKK